MNEKSNKIKVLAVLALCFFLVGFINKFITFAPDVQMAGGVSLNASFRLPSLKNWVDMAISVIPYILLVIHCSKFNKTIKIHIVLPAVFALYTLDNLIGVFNAYFSYPKSIMYAVIYAVFTAIFALSLTACLKLKKHYADVKTLTAITVILGMFSINNLTVSVMFLNNTTVIFNMILAVAFFLAAFASIKGINKNYFAVFALIADLFFIVANIVLTIYSVVISVPNLYYLQLIPEMISVAGQCCMCITLLLCILKKRKAVS